MTYRERRLAIIVGSLIGLFALWLFVRNVIFSPIWQAQAEVDSLLADQTALKAKVEMEPSYKRQWAQLRSKTLHGDPNVAAGQLDVVMKKVMQDAGLVNLSVNVGRPREEKKTWPGLYIIPYTVVQADGDMEKFTKFLHAFYQQPYAMQILSFNLEQPPLARANALHISSLLIEAVVLSSDGMPASLTSQPAGVQPEQAKPWRPADPNLDHYAVIWQKKFMEPFSDVPPPPPPPVKQEPTVAAVMISPSGGTVTTPMDVRITCGTPGAAIRYTTDGSMPTATAGNVYDTNTPIRVSGPLTIKAVAFKADLKDSPLAIASFTPPPAAPLKLIGLWTYGSVSEVVLLNEQSKERVYIREGDPFDGGKLLLVLPEAAVVGMPDGPRFVYWLGKPVKDKEQLDPAKQPDIAAAVEILVESH
jgi:hypothetical protein